MLPVSRWALFLCDPDSMQWGVVMELRHGRSTQLGENVSSDSDVATIEDESSSWSTADNWAHQIVEHTIVSGVSFLWHRRKVKQPIDVHSSSTADSDVAPDEVKQAELNAFFPDSIQVSIDSRFVASVAAFHFDVFFELVRMSCAFQCLIRSTRLSLS